MWLMTNKRDGRAAVAYTQSIMGYLKSLHVEGDLTTGDYLIRGWQTTMEISCSAVVVLRGKLSYKL